MTKEAYKNRRLWFGTETSPYDPRYQTEDLGDNAMKASDYGIKNLKRILPNLIEWSKKFYQDWLAVEVMDKKFKIIILEKDRENSQNK